MASPGPIVVNPWHWLRPDGGFLSDSPVRAKAIRVAQFIEYGGPLEAGESRPTLLACRKRPDGRACQGFLYVMKEDDDAITAFCPSCASAEYIISDWQDTFWAGGQAPASREFAYPRQSVEVPPKPAPKKGDIDIDEHLVRGLREIGSPLTPGEVKAALLTAKQPLKAIQYIFETCRKPREEDASNRFLALIMATWNSLPREELRGYSPDQVHERAPLTKKVGRNEPCPCGSGKKFKRCCLNNSTLH